MPKIVDENLETSIFPDLKSLYQKQSVDEYLLNDVLVRMDNTFL
jgi:hypothetical protein